MNNEKENGSSKPNAVDAMLISINKSIQSRNEKIEDEIKTAFHFFKKDYEFCRHHSQKKKGAYLSLMGQQRAQKYIFDALNLAKNSGVPFDFDQFNADGFKIMEGLNKLIADFLENEDDNEDY